MGGLGEGNPDHEEDDSSGDHGDDRGDFDETQPKLEFAEYADLAGVDGRDKQDDGAYPYPFGCSGKPQSHIDRKRGDIGDGYDDHFKDEGPPGDEARKWPEILGGVGTERTRNGPPYRHFAQRAHHPENGSPRDHVGQQDQRACCLDGGC